MKAGGVDLGGAQMALLKKIEELTLYTLEQHEQLGALQQELAEKDAALERHLANQQTENADLAQRVAALEQQLASVAQ